MQNVAIVNQYIDHVPWEGNPAFAFGDDAAKYEEAFRNVIEFVPDTDEKILFEEDTWDFRPFFKDINSNSYKFLFAAANDDYKDYLKFFTIYAIGRKSKISTVERRVSDFITLITSIEKTTNHNSFSLITTDDIIDNIENILSTEDSDDMRPLMEGIRKLAGELGIPILMSYGYAQAESEEELYPEEREYHESLGNMCDVYLELQYADMITEDSLPLTVDDIREMVEEGESLLIDVFMHKNRRPMKASLQIQGTPKHNFFEE